MTGKVPETWRTPLAIAALLVSGFGLLMTMNRTDEATAVELEGRIRTLEARVTSLEKASDARVIKLRGRHVFMNAAGSRVEYLCNTDPECRVRFDPMNIPE